jgi:hypothetical protein
VRPSKVMTLALLACSACNMLPTGSKFGIRCTGHERNLNDALSEDEQGIYDTQEIRTYALDGGKKAIYRAEPTMVVNQCGADAKCAVDFHDDQVKGLFSGSRRVSQSEKLNTETLFLLNRKTGDLKVTQHFKIQRDGESYSSSTIKGEFSCVTTAMPKFRMPDA